MTRIRSVTAFVGSELEPRHVDIVIADGKIESVEEAVATGDPKLGDLDGSGLLALPGMVDCHDHLRYLGPGRSIGEGLPFDELLKALTASVAAMGAAEYEIGVLLGLVQRLKVGITAVADHCYPYHLDGLDDAVLAGYKRSGVRWVYARGVQTKPEAVAEPWELAEERIRSFALDVPPARLFVAPVSIRQADLADYEHARELADELSCGLYTHVAETEAEIKLWRTLSGTSPIRALDAVGFLTSRTVLVHCVLLDDGEIELLAERRCHVIHCPNNHMKWAKGFTRVPELLDAGVNVALGVDNELDLMSEMRAERGLQALRTMNRDAISLSTVMQMATWRGAEALGLEPLTGKIEPGMCADIVLLDGRSLQQAPMIDPRYAVVYSTHPGDVRHVFVDGEQLVKDGRCTHVDEEALLEEAEAVAASWLARAGSNQAPWFTRAGVGAAG